MTIPASHIVKVSPRVISGGSADLETNGMLLTKSALIPSGIPALEFTLASEVAAYFGDESAEAKFAQQYFTGVNNQQAAVRLLVVGRYVDEPVAAWVRGTEPVATLKAFKEVTDGALKLVVNSAEVSASGIDLSGATSLSEVAEKIAAKFDGVSGAYDSNLEAFVFTTEETGESAMIEVSSVAVAEGTDLKAMLGLEDGGLISVGMDAMSASKNLDRICGVTRNWVGFATLWEASLEEAEGFAAWADIDDDYVYIDWTMDRKACNQLTQAETKPAKLMDRFNCAACLFGDYQFAAFVLAVGASIDWNRNQGMKAWFAKSASGLTPEITDEDEANALEKIRCSYYGSFATRNARFNFMNPGALCSSHYGFIDTLYGSIYLRNAIQRSCMDGITSINRAPYNESGRAFISAWLQDPITKCLRNGVIDAGLTLSASQKTQIMQEVGLDISNDLFTAGYWYGIEMPDANVRAQRGSPIVSVLYCYAGNIQRLDCSVTTVI